jgi:hypothetical protein
MKPYVGKIVTKSFADLYNAVIRFGHMQFRVIGNAIHSPKGYVIDTFNPEGSVLNLHILDWENAVDIQLFLTHAFQSTLTVYLPPDNIPEKVYTFPQPSCSIAKGIEWSTKIRATIGSMKKVAEVGILPVIDNPHMALIASVFTDEKERFWYEMERLFGAVKAYLLAQKEKEQPIKDMLLNRARLHSLDQKAFETACAELEGLWT